MEAIKEDSGKPQITLIDPDFLFKMAYVLSKGAEKYGKNNWKGLKSERTINAMLRHALKCTETEIIENSEDFGEMHEVYVAVEAMMSYCIKRDNKFKYTKN